MKLSCTLDPGSNSKVLNDLLTNVEYSHATQSSLNPVPCNLKSFRLVKGFQNILGHWPPFVNLFFLETQSYVVSIFPPSCAEE